MKRLANLLFTVLLLAASCKKENTLQPPQPSEGAYISTVQQSLKDSLSLEDYHSLDFTRSSASGIDSLHIKLLRIPLVSKSIATDFFVVKTDYAGHIISGRFIRITKDSSDKVSFTGTVCYRPMKGVQVNAVSLVKGHFKAASHGAVDQLMADEPEMDGGDLPPVVVTASYGSSGISYADWYNLVEMAGDDGYGYTGYYSPSSGGGGGSAAPTMQVDFEAPENKDAIDIKKYIKCFGATQEANATYTVTIAVDLPVDNDPSKIFNWSDASPGHTFIELYKNSSAGLVEQHIGLYPNYPWKTVGGGNVSSKVADDAGHEYQAKYTISVSGTQFANALQAASAYSNFDYNVATFNCADYALKVFRAAGGQLNVPQFPVPEYSDASNTPQGVYDAIQGLVMNGNPNAMANAQKQWIGESHGPCN